MNFLAHAQLSPATPEALMVGNTLGDFFKGQLKGLTDKDLKTGVMLHRAIDSYTDTHPVVRQARQLLFPQYRHYARVLVDIYYDHFLALNFSRVSGSPLREFVTEVYEILLKPRPALPPLAREVAQVMAQHNWLEHYQTIAGVQRACTGMARRYGGSAQILSTGATALQKHYADLHENFTRYYPQLQAYVAQWLAERSI